MGEDAGTQGDVFFEVTLCEAVATELELGWLDVGEIRVEDPERIQLCDVVTTHLVGAHQKLHLEKRRQKPCVQYQQLLTFK